MSGTQFGSEQAQLVECVCIGVAGGRQLQAPGSSCKSLSSGSAFYFKKEHTSPSGRSGMRRDEAWLANGCARLVLITSADKALAGWRYDSRAQVILPTGCGIGARQQLLNLIV